MTLQSIQTARLVWKDLKTCPKELHLDTLKCGQSFRWRQTKDLWYVEFFCDRHNWLNRDRRAGLAYYRGSFVCCDKRVNNSCFVMGLHEVILIPMYAYADSTVFYGVQPEDDEHQVKQLDTLLRDYFQLDRVSLQSCYKRWSDLDANFKAKAIHFAGIRMLRQDPWENLVSFICSSNNNIPRISQMVNNINK